MQFFLVLVPLHELLHESDCHFAILKLGSAVLILNGWGVNEGGKGGSVTTATVSGEEVSLPGMGQTWLWTHRSREGRSK